jgi:hypothetical protein
MWVFAVKYNQTDGSVDRFKARLVARGDSQLPGIDYDETYAPVAGFTSFRMIVALATHLDLILEHFDITTASLYGDIDTEIYRKQPPGCRVKG